MLPIYFLEWWSGQSHDDYAPSTFLSVWRDDMDGCSLLELFPASTETPLWGFPLYVFIWDPSLPFGVSHSTTVSASEWSQDFLTTFSEACFFFFFSGQINPLTCQNFHMISFAPQLFRFYGKMLYLFPDGLVKKNAIFIIIIVVVVIIIIFCSVLTEAKSVIQLNLPWSPRRFHTTYAFLWWLHVWVCIWFSYMAAPSSL